MLGDKLVRDLLVKPLLDKEFYDRHGSRQHLVVPLNHLLDALCVIGWRYVKLVSAVSDFSRAEVDDERTLLEARVGAQENFAYFVDPLASAPDVLLVLLSLHPLVLALQVAFHAECLLVLEEVELELLVIFLAPFAEKRCYQFGSLFLLT